MSSDEFGRGAWYDRWFVSREIEELERTGLAGHGQAIIKELNRVYDRTGVLRRFALLLLSEARAIFARTHKPVRLLDVGMRDGTLLHLVSDVAEREGVPLELHGVEFREDIVAFARESCMFRGDRVSIRHDPSRILVEVEPGSFDIVCSTFVLHHLTAAECARLLSASNRAAQFSVAHLDLARSLPATVLLWTYYTLFRHTLSRHDSVLSCRRSFRMRELERLLGHDTRAMSVHRLLPMYLMVERRIGKHS
jgi:hypothetical protein